MDLVFVGKRSCEVPWKKIMIERRKTKTSFESCTWMMHVAIHEFGHSCT